MDDELTLVTPACQWAQNMSHVAIAGALFAEEARPGLCGERDGGGPANRHQRDACGGARAREEQQQQQHTHLQTSYAFSFLSCLSPVCSLTRSLAASLSVPPRVRACGRHRA